MRVAGAQLRMCQGCQVDSRIRSERIEAHYLQRSVSRVGSNFWKYNLFLGIIWLIMAGRFGSKYFLLTMGRVQFSVGEFGSGKIDSRTTLKQRRI